VCGTCEKEGSLCVALVKKREVCMWHLWKRGRFVWGTCKEWRVCFKGTREENEQRWERMKKVVASQIRSDY
jgi:hypothetical protein